MILESIVTTRNSDGTANVAPMGPHVDDPDMNEFELRPFQESATFENLQARPWGVLNITDDALLIAQAVVGHLPEDLLLCRATDVAAEYLGQACRIIEFRVVHADTSGPRATLKCCGIRQQRLRDFFGFNRARHLIIEAAILATRLDFQPAEVLEQKIAEFKPVIEKTGGPREHQALELLSGFLASHQAENRIGQVK